MTLLEEVLLEYYEKQSKNFQLDIVERINYTSAARRLSGK